MEDRIKELENKVKEQESLINKLIDAFEIQANTLDKVVDKIVEYNK